MIKSPSRTALDAAACLYALGVLKRVGLAADVSRQEVIRRLDVARSYAYELYPRVEAALTRGFDVATDQDVVDRTAELLCLQVRTTVLEYRLEHPGCWVCGGNYPPGTSKWNKIEHRLFSFITLNWRGKPLRTYQTIVSLIAATTTETGLEVRCELDDSSYQKGRKVSDDELKAINIKKHRFHPEWNHTISPRYA